MNANLLRGKMAEKRMSQSELAKRIGMSENSLSRKLLGTRDFRLAEIIKIIDELQIQNPGEIFFANLVPKMQRNVDRIHN
nr:helix-turn-helix transcriptional regulator [uncultured Aminipila sp.]